MKKLFCALAAASTLYGVTAAAQGHPLLEKAAAKVVQKYQSSSCQQLAAQRGEPPSDSKKKVVEMMRENPQLREEFLNRVAGPIVNRLFECGLIP